MDWVGTNQAGKELGITQSQVTRLVRLGRLRARRLSPGVEGGPWQVARDAKFSTYRDQERKPGPKPNKNNRRNYV